MFTKLPQTKTVRTGKLAHPFGFVTGGAGSISSKDDSDEAEDPGSDQPPEDNDEDIEESDYKPTQSAYQLLNGTSNNFDGDLFFSGIQGFPDPLAPPSSDPSNAYNAPSIDPGIADQGPSEPFTSQDESNQKDLDEAIKDYSRLLSKLTISRDETEASDFDKERLLAIDDETFRRQLETQIISQPAGNHALQDYQMQLMLLEQQNKKRLLLARQEQENMASGTSDLPYSGSSHIGRNLDAGFNPMLPPDIRRSPVPFQSTNLSSFRAEVAAQTHGQVGESDLVSRLLKRIEDLERGSNISEHSPSERPRSPRFQVLHVLDDDNKTVCLQDPTWTFGQGSGLRLKAELPLFDLDSYLRRNDEILFLVFKSYATPRISTTDLAENLETGVLPAPEPSQEYIEIRSEELRMALSIYLKSTHSADEEQPPFPMDTIQAPYLFWYHSRSNSQALSELLPKHQDLLKLLVNWIENNYAAKYNQFDQMISRGRISHTFAEYLFYPGDVVVSKDREKTKAYRLQGVPALKRIYGREHHSQALDKLSRPKSKTTGKSSGNAAWRWDVPCWTIVYDGEFYRQSLSLTLELVAESHDEEIDISELNVIPLRYVGEDVQQRLMQRGRTFWSCRIKRPVSYQGGDEEALHTDGERYVIDNKSYKKLHLDAQKSKRNQESMFTGTVDRTPLFVEEMDDDEPPPAPAIYLFPPTISGFSLRRKRWTDLVVDKITDISWNKEAFKHLVADDKTKELVQALVADRIAGERNTDIIQGKGNGLIILLHGGPGTGKTFTAESVAELAEKPLYPVTCGDIGTEPEEVERYLESVLYLGNLWDCVVLLDEADVFLEERGIADLARNALVSVFLRVLEYYDGILILTSNRVGTFDEAFKSRISLALHYPNFTKSQRCRIWKNFLNRLRSLKEPNIDFDDIECNVIELANEELNGRQIRNAITIGRQLAKFQKKDLSYAHLKHVVEVAGQFETYVKKTKENLSDEEIARFSGRRW